MLFPSDFATYLPLNENHNYDFLKMTTQTSSAEHVAVLQHGDERLEGWVVEAERERDPNRLSPDGVLQRFLRVDVEGVGQRCRDVLGEAYFGCGRHDDRIVIDRLCIGSYFRHNRHLWITKLPVWRRKIISHTVRKQLNANVEYMM